MTVPFNRTVPGGSDRTRLWGDVAAAVHAITPNLIGSGRHDTLTLEWEASRALTSPENAAVDAAIAAHNPAPLPPPPTQIVLTTGQVVTMGSVGGGATIVQTVLSFGAVPTNSAVFVRSHVGALPTMAVVVTRREPTLDSDENAGGWDDLSITARAETGQVRLLVESPHLIRGDFPVAYLVA